MFILSANQVLPTLSTFIDIEDIPRKYGGKLDFECGMMPVLDPQIRDCLDIKGGPEGEKLFVSAPVRWIEAGEDGEMTALGVGSINGKPRQETVATLHSLAVRVASHSRMFQSQRTQVVTPYSRPDTPKSTVPSSTSRPASLAPNRAAAPTPLANTQSIPQAAPVVRASNEYVSDQPKSVTDMLAKPTQNGGPPDKISMPPPPVQMERIKTEYMTPPTDPSEIKQLG